ncbi:MAG: hypothetical protein ABS46_18320 [Cytophagaceae bacterium SCN 52-12]|nr:MAG: hypothetical protein ABS46_18320 [Cytophagaceae bacterium SCN 52-12]
MITNLNSLVRLKAPQKCKPNNLVKIYDQHNRAFQNVSAYVVMKDGHIVATVTFKFPKDGAGRLSAYVHFLGTQMVRGFANGYGYDKRSAAVENAMQTFGHVQTPTLNGFEPFFQALANYDGTHWANALRSVGFAVFQVI